MPRNCSSALVIGFAFGFAPKHTNVLCRLVEADWHISHEDIVSALDHLRTPDAVGALYQATPWIPDHLSFDDSRALAAKAIRALGRIPGSEAEGKLVTLARSEDRLVREQAGYQLKRRHEAT